MDIFNEKFDEIPEIKCLDLGYVRLIDSMPREIREGEETLDYAIAEAARCSYQRGTKSVNDDKVLIRYLMRHNHTSPFEMIEFKFHMKLPLFIARQMIRHRTASLNELSGRYSEMPEEYYLPPINDYRTQDSVNRQGSAGNIDSTLANGMMQRMNGHAEADFALYNKLLKEGLVREQARTVLPLSTYTEWYWKMDLKNLLHFLDLRCDSHAQKEIRVYADAILSLISPLIPYTIEAWEDYSPYRGGMTLTRYEVEELRESIKWLDGDYNDIRQIQFTNISNKLEYKEWKEKANKLGLGINSHKKSEPNNKIRNDEF